MDIFHWHIEKGTTLYYSIIGIGVLLILLFIWSVLPSKSPIDDGVNNVTKDEIFSEEQVDDVTIEPSVLTGSVDSINTGNPYIDSDIEVSNNNNNILENMSIRDFNNYLSHIVNDVQKSVDGLSDIETKTFKSNFYQHFDKNATNKSYQETIVYILKYLYKERQYTILEKIINEYNKHGITYILNGDFVDKIKGQRVIFTNLIMDIGG